MTRAWQEVNKTAVKHGISAPELKRLAAAVWFMRTQGTLLFVTNEAHKYDERTKRNRFAGFKNNAHRVITDLSSMCGIDDFPVYGVEVLEAEYALHQHLVYTLPTKKIRGRSVTSIAKERLASSKLYGSHLTFLPVPTPERLINYLLKEATPQAHYRRSFYRKPGSHPLGEGGGDRVRLTRNLEQDLIALGRIQPYRKSYASRALPVVAQVAEPPPPVVEVVKQPEPPARPIQLALPLDLKPPPPILQLVEAQRRDLGLTQREAARMLGLKQPAYSNAIVRHHDRLSPWAMNRAREFVAGRLAA